MTIFNPNTPLSTDILSDSQLDLNNNNTANNTWSSVDHYALDNMTANNGFHAHVTSPTPANSMHYANPGINTILYGMQDATQIGNIQYSRGPNNTVPSPVTTLQSSSAGLTVSMASPATVLNFASPVAIPQCYGILTAIGFLGVSATPTLAFAVFGANNMGNGITVSTFAPDQFQPTHDLKFAFSGTTIILTATQSASTYNKCAWTLRFERIWTPA